MEKETKAKIMLNIKRNKVVRLLAAPFVIHKREKMKKEFCDTEDGRYLKTLKNKFEGKRCFILGNGPSLTTDDLDRLKNEYTFASNKILYLLDKTCWKPTFYCCDDPEAIVMISAELSRHDIEYKFLNVSAKNAVKQKNVHYMFNYTPYKLNRYDIDFGSICISEDISRYLSIGYTVTFTSIQLAVYMGFREIYLLGCDHNYSAVINRRGEIKRDSTVQTYARGIPDWGKSVQNVEVTEYAYKVARKYCDEHGIKIFNATRGGKLEIFERVNLDMLLDNIPEETK